MPGMHPFDHQNPVFDEEAFLDRAAETKKLLGMVTKGENVLVYGYRRRGKTSLIRRVQGKLPKGTATIYLDGYLCIDAVEAGTRLLAGLAETGLGKGPRFVKWAQEVAARLDVTINLGGKDAPVQLHVKVGERRDRTPFLNALEFIGHIADRSGKPVVVVLDEFQEILDLINGEEGLKAMRAVVQMQRNVSYIISGSSVSTLREITAHPSKGFWTQLTHFPIKGLTILDVQADVERVFGAKLEDDAKKFLLETLGDCTQRLVQVLGLAHPGLSLPSLREAVRVAVEKNAPTYQTELRHITSSLEKQLLFALAREHTKEPRSVAWLRRHGITASPAGVHQALARLQDDVLDDGYRFVDTLFPVYLAQ